MDTFVGLPCTSDMETKLNKIRCLAEGGDWAGALRIAARFADLGEHRAAIVRAHEVSHSPAFYRQLGVDPEKALAAGVEALRARYKLP